METNSIMETKKKSGNQIFTRGIDALALLLSPVHDTLFDFKGLPLHAIVNVANAFFPVLHSLLGEIDSAKFNFRQN